MSLDALDITPRRVAIIDAATDRLEELLNGTTSHESSRCDSTHSDL
jgi:hypothetical protein